MVLLTSAACSLVKLTSLCCREACIESMTLWFHPVGVLLKYLATVLGDPTGVVLGMICRPVGGPTGVLLGWPPR